MLRYEGAECPYCHQMLRDGDDITVCPQCGAPYHRECAKKAGGCVLTQLHAEGRQWQKISRPGENTIDGLAQLRCSRCGTLNQPGAKICEICGTPLDNQQPGSENDSFGNANTARPNYSQNESDQGWNQPSWQQGTPGMPPFQMPFDPFVNPMGGLDPEETIDDIPAKDIAVYVKQNTPYFLPKFKAFFGKQENGKKRTFSWNWAAFLLDTYYLFYRKMYGLGAIVMVLSLLLSIPSLLMSFDSLMTVIDAESTLVTDLGISPEKLLILYNMCSFLSFAMKATLAALSNRLYAAHALKDIHRIRKEKGDSAEYHTALSNKGGVSLISVAIAIAITAAISVSTSMIFLQYIGI